jgi:hypothetical protein
MTTAVFTAFEQEMLDNGKLVQDCLQDADGSGNGFVQDPSSRVQYVIGYVRDDSYSSGFRCTYWRRIEKPWDRPGYFRSSLDSVPA